VQQIRTQPAAPLSPDNFKLPMPAPLPGISTPEPTP
jgi:hypothetical protein